AQVEAAWFEAVGAEQQARMREAAARAGEASAKLARRYHEAGNTSARALAGEEASASLLALAALSARAEAQAARSRLNRLMGLDAARNHWVLPTTLPLPPAQDEDADALLRLAADSRLDI